jgi:hypothetical protein
VSNCDFVAGGSLIDLAASRLALRAPALRAATALTRPNQSGQRLPCGRHGVPTAATVGPNQIVANHGVENGEHLAHHRHDYDFRLLPGRPKTVVECLEHRVPVAGAHRTHVEHAANRCAAAPDATCSLELATVERRRERHRPGLRSPVDQAGRARARERSACKPARRRPPARKSATDSADRDLDQTLIEQGDVGREPGYAASRKPLQHRIFQQPRGILGGNLLWRVYCRTRVLGRLRYAGP